MPEIQSDQLAPWSEDRDANNQQLINLGAGTAAGHAINKQQLDDAIAAGGGGRLIAANTADEATATGLGEDLHDHTLDGVALFPIDGAFIEIRLWYTLAANGNNKQIQIQWDGDDLYDSGSIAANGGTVGITVVGIRQDSNDLRFLVTVVSSNASWPDSTSAVNVNGTLGSIVFKTLATAASGDLTQNASLVWSGATAAPSVSLTDLDDTDIASPAEDEVLGYDGVNWANRTLEDAGITPRAWLHALAQCRLEWQSTTQVRLNAWLGNLLMVAGEPQTVDGATGGFQLAPSDNRIDSTGADAGASMASGTLYYVYRSNSLASFAASNLRASTTAPSLVDGIYYLGTSGNALNWRFVGWVRTDGSTQFVDSVTQRLVRSWYHPRQVPVRAVDSTDSWTYNSATWRPSNGNAATKVECISDGILASQFTFHQPVLIAATNTQVAAAIGLDSSSSPTALGFNSFGGDPGTAARVVEHLTAQVATVLAAGYHEVWPLESVPDAAGNVTFYGDRGTAGVQAGLIGLVWC